MKSVFTYYKDRLIEISGRNRSLYLKNFNKKNGYDLGKILYENQDKAKELLDNLWNGFSTPFRLIGKETKDSIIKSSDIDKKFPTQKFSDEKEAQKYDRKKKEYAKKVIESECQSIRMLKREIEEIEKETGRYELYLCYPFVYGSAKNYLFKAPLCMFPVTLEVIDDNNVDISLKYGDNIQLNRALLLAIADAYRLNLEDLETECESLIKFQGIEGLLSHLRTFGIKIAYQPRKHVFPFNRYSEPCFGDQLEIKNLCVLSRCSLANSIYTDYSALEKRHLTNDSINELLNTKVINHKPEKPGKLFLTNNVDYAQQQVVQQVNTSGNMVIYGPPGTGKSQTIVNIISDAIAKNKKVLIVSQKKAALEVIYNRMGTLNEKAMFIIDSEKQKHNFYTRCFNAHEKMFNTETNDKLIEKYEDIERQLAVEENNLQIISDCLTTKTHFGVSPQEMYCNSYKIGKNSTEYSIYQEMLKNKKLMELKYDELVNAITLVKEKNKAEIYYNFVEDKKTNPFIDHLQDSLSVHTVAETQSKLEKLCATRKPLFDTAKYKYSRHVITYYHLIKANKDISPLIKMIVKFEDVETPKVEKQNNSFFSFSFARQKMTNKEKIVAEQIQETLDAIEEYTKDYEFLKNVLTNDGYLMALDGLLNGNNSILRLILWAMQNYIKLRDINIILKNLEDNQKTILNFAYKITNTYLKYKQVIDKILPIRVYHEIVDFETYKKDELSTIVNFENIRARIVSLKNELNAISKQIASECFVDEYKKMFKGTSESKDYVYQISKKQSYWSIRKTMSVYGKYIFKLFPCWLLSPENVSTLLPLEKNMFDIVLFDEASQVFIENTIPTIYRGNRVVVAGDAKQLRPTATFMKRYMGANIDDSLDYSTQAALEVESLLDLAVSRFNSANITYHYRSKHEELIDFSNKVFYDNKLQIAPNVSRNVKQKPIERVLVDGMWDNRKNMAEAKKVVELTKQLLKTRKNNETIGIITFNSEQETTIEDLIDKECSQNDEFRRLFIQESNRIENGEDVSLFIKNLENVQGDERDIIIFSIGYANNQYGKINTQFGSLSNEGGENRLNVAITRAKKKIYVVTSIEPEELKVDGSKFAGPKLLRSYLTYVRAVSEGKTEEVKTILNSFTDGGIQTSQPSLMPGVEEQIAEKLNKLGYKTSLNLGNSNSKISVAIYDAKKDRYLLGIETDQSVLQTSSSTMERDVYRNQFLQSRGWKIMRVWNRDFWHNPSQVISTIVKEVEKQKKLLYAEADKTKKVTKPTATTKTKPQTSEKDTKKVVTENKTNKKPAVAKTTSTKTEKNDVKPANKASSKSATVTKTNK